jgi:hypothetical protein
MDVTGRLRLSFRAIAIRHGTLLAHARLATVV